jgi:cysteinyl-tRNA synthetase
MHAAQISADRLAAAAALAEHGQPDGEDTTIRQARLEFVAALENDMRTPQALRVLEGLAERALTTGRAAYAAELRELGSVLGLSLPAASSQVTQPSAAHGHEH